MLFCHAHIEKALGKFPIEELKPRAVFHSRGNCAQILMRFPKLDQLLAKFSGKAGRRRNIRIQYMFRVKRRNPVEFSGVLFCRLKAFSLYSHHMDEKRSRLLLQVAECGGKSKYVVPIQRANVLEAHLLKHCGVVNVPAQKLFGSLHAPFDGLPHQRNGVQKALYILFGLKIAWVCAQCGEVASHIPHIL